MKRSLLLSVLLLSGGLLSSCISSPERLSSNTIVKQYNKLLKGMAIQDHFVELNVGKYELNDDDSRLKLRELEAADIVSYSVERYPWWEKTVQNYMKPYTITHNYWGSQYHETQYKMVKEDRYNFEDHYIVNIGLTKKGQSLLVTEMPQPVEEVDKDMKQPEVDKSKYAWNKKDLTENWPYIENPFLKKEEPKPEETDNSTPSNQGGSKPRTTETPTQKVKDPTVRIDSLKYQAYQTLETTAETVTLKGYSVKAFKARNIQIFQKDGYPVATADVLIKTYNTTDAARILEDREDGEKVCTRVTLKYYIDKGWVLDRSSSEVDFDDYDYDEYDY